MSIDQDWTRAYCRQTMQTRGQSDTTAAVATLEHVNNTEAWKMDRWQTRPTVRKILYAAGNRIELWLFTSIVWTLVLLITAWLNNIINITNWFHSPCHALLSRCSRWLLW